MSEILKGVHVVFVSLSLFLVLIYTTTWDNFQLIHVRVYNYNNINPFTHMSLLLIGKLRAQVDISLPITSFKLSREYWVDGSQISFEAPIGWGGHEILI